jgi:uncharacterized protein YjiS (DUF1127 family)
MTTLIMTADKIGLHSVAEWFKRLNAKLQKRAMVKRTIKELSQLSDRELNDMGLARGDIYSVAHGTSDHIRGAQVNKNLEGWV